MQDKRKLIFSLIVIFTLNILIIMTAQSHLRAGALSYGRGSAGKIVTRLQERLISGGYLSGRAGGVFGSETESAVKRFQKDKGLTRSGTADKKTLLALGIADKSVPSREEADTLLLARLISGETRGESYKAQVAVGAVAVNRLKHPAYPDTLPGVIYSRGAFSGLQNGEFFGTVPDSAMRAARDALSGTDPTGGAVAYTNSENTPRPVLTTIGERRFF